MRFFNNSLCKLFFAASLVVQYDLAFAQESPNSSGDYYYDLAQMILIIKSVPWMVDICAEVHPGSTAYNRAAANNWHKRNKPVINEMTSRYERLLKPWDKADRQSVKATAETWRKLSKKIDDRREQMRNDFLAEGEEKSRQFCYKYPDMLSHSTFDLERHYANVVAAIRRKPV